MEEIEVVLRGFVVGSPVSWSVFDEVGKEMRIGSTNKFPVCSYDICDHFDRHISLLLSTMTCRQVPGLVFAFV